MASQKGIGAHFSNFQRDVAVERQFGEPDFESWKLYQHIEKDATKNGVVRALHIIVATAGGEIEHARDVMNTYTLALYRKGNSGEYLADAYNKPRSYSEPHWYIFIYDESEEFRETQAKRRTQLNKTELALNSAWAKRVMMLEGASPIEVEKRFEKLLRRWA